MLRLHHLQGVKAIPIFFILGLTIVFFGRLFYPEPQFFITPDFGLSDILHLNLPLKISLARALKENRLPFIENNLANGFPMYNELETGTFNLSNLILFKFLDPFTAFNLNLALSFFLTTLFTYLYLKLLKLQTLPALFGATSFGFSFYLVTQISHYNVLQCISFLPSLLYFWERYRQTQKLANLVFFSFLLSQQVFAGSPQINFISLLFLFFYTLYFNGFKFRESQLKNLFLFFIFVFLGLGLAGIQLVPSLKYFSLSTRQKGTDPTAFSYPYKHLLTLLNPFSLGNPQQGTYPPFNENEGSIFWENSAYFGILALILALAAIFFWKQSKFIRFFFFSTLTALLLMAGKYSPFYFLFTFPFFNIFRVPSRFILVFVFSLSVLAAFTLREITLKKKSRFLKLMMVLLLFLNLADLFRWGYGYHPLVTVKELTQKPATAVYLTAQTSPKIYTLDFPQKWNEIFNQEGWQSPKKYLDLSESLWPDLNLLWQIPNLGVYKNFITRRFQVLDDLLKAKEPGLTEKLWKQQGINFIITPEKLSWFEEKNLVFEVKKEGIANFYLYQLKEKLPFARFAYQPFKAETLLDFKQLISQESFDLNQDFISEEELPVYSPSKTSPSITLLKKESNRLNFAVDNPQPSYFILQQAYLPGWTALVNGRKTKIYPVNLNQMAIALPPGQNLIQFRYLPEGWYLGLFLSGFSLASLLTILLISAAGSSRAVGSFPRIP